MGTLVLILQLSGVLIFSKYKWVIEYHLEIFQNICASVAAQNEEIKTFPGQCLGIGISKVLGPPPHPPQ